MHDPQIIWISAAGLMAGISCWAMPAFRTKRLASVALEGRTDAWGLLATYRQLSHEAPRSAMQEQRNSSRVAKTHA
jgi:hypothetical protein